MRRIAAAWRLRSRERAHGAPLAVIAVLIACTLATPAVAGGSTRTWVLAGLVSLFWAGVWLWGLWDEGGRIARVPRTYRSRRRRS